MTNEIQLFDEKWLNIDETLMSTYRTVFLISCNFKYLQPFVSGTIIVCLCFVQEEHSWGSGSRGQGPGSPSLGEGASPEGRLERTPSFTAEWEEVTNGVYVCVQLRTTLQVKGLTRLLNATLHVLPWYALNEWSLQGAIKTSAAKAVSCSHFATSLKSTQLLKCRRSRAHLTHSHIDFLLIPALELKERPNC